MNLIFLMIIYYLLETHISLFIFCNLLIMLKVRNLWLQIVLKKCLMKYGIMVFFFLKIKRYFFNKDSLGYFYKMIFSNFRRIRSKSTVFGTVFEKWLFGTNSTKIWENHCAVKLSNLMRTKSKLNRMRETSHTNQSYVTYLTAFDSLSFTVEYHWI